MAKKNPEWEYHLWGREEIERLVESCFPDFPDTYKNFQHKVQQWDSARYMILYKYGGLYIDLDTECLRDEK
ncbi:MAG: hypothetical protein LBJ60_06050 [Tannerellaceae bacterium]|nr:hypothetical protein [Tannerellaceae bacterium]